LRPTEKLARRIRGNARKKNNSKPIEAEAAFTADLYRDRAALNSKAQRYWLPDRAKLRSV
jgi:hypothetical protein